MLFTLVAWALCSGLRSARLLFIINGRSPRARPKVGARQGHASPVLQLEPARLHV